MNSVVKKIAVLLGLIIVLPIAFFIFNELSSLNEREDVLNTIYSNQLEAILFSVNQYSEDVLSSWAGHTNILLDQLGSASPDNSEQVLEKFYDEHPSVNMVFFSEGTNPDNVKLLYPSKLRNSLVENINRAKIITDVSSVILDNEQLISRLYTYQRGGYRKIEPLVSPLFSGYTILLFTLDMQESKNICGLIIEPRNFVFRILSPKIQAVAREEFVISVLNKKNNFQFNSTKDFQVKQVQLVKPLWIIPDYELGISLVGETIQDLVRKRTTENIILISILAVILMAAVFIVYRNVRKEVELAQIKADFVSNVSHELRTPLALISMFAETLDLDRVRSEEKKKEYYRIISQETNRLGRIVNTILNFSKTEAGKRKYHFSPADINELTEQVYNNYSFHLHNKGFEFNFIRDDKIPPVDVDAEALSEAIINLIDNAVKYSAGTKVVTIRTGAAADSVFIEVEDKGIGISEVDQKRIFEKFYRVSTGAVHNVKGTGLGLSLVKHIVDAHGGSISLKSRLNEGSAFRISLPLTIKK